MFSLAVRYLMSRKRQTALILAGTVLGAMTYVVISGLLGGYQFYIVNRLISNDAHLRIRPQDRLVSAREITQSFYSGIAHVFWLHPPRERLVRPYIGFPEMWFARLKSHPSVAAFTPQLISRVNIARANTVRTVEMIGTLPEEQVRVTTIGDSMVQGRFEALQSGGNHLVIGKRLMDNLGTYVGETVSIINQRGHRIPFQVIGVFETGVRDMDNSTVFTSLHEAQKIEGNIHKISDIAVRLVDIQTASALAQDWKHYPENILTWEDLNTNTVAVYRLQNLISALLILSIVVVVGFGIYNVLQMLIHHKMQEIAILQAIGFEPSDIARLFLFQGAILGAAGGIVGGAIGYMVSLYLRTVSVGKLSISAQGHLFISLSPTIYVNAFLLTFIACLASSFFPARAASRLTPIEIIRSKA